MDKKYKKMLKTALDTANSIAKLTSNRIDDIIVAAAVSILYRVFKLQEVD